MPLSTTVEELIAKLLPMSGPAPREETTVLEPSASADIEYMDRVFMQFYLTSAQVDAEVLINLTTVTDLGDSVIQSGTIQAGVVKFTGPELLTLPGAAGFFEALASAAHDKLEAQRAEMEPPPPGPPAPFFEPPLPGHVQHPPL